MKIRLPSNSGSGRISRSGLANRFSDELAQAGRRFHRLRCIVAREVGGYDPCLRRCALIVFKAC